jgi:hypothetical protein
MVWEGSASAYRYPVIAAGVAAVRAGFLVRSDADADSRPMVACGQVAAHANSAPAAPLAPANRRRRDAAIPSV